MTEKATLVRGMRDLMGEELAGIRLVEEAFSETLTSYGYEPIRMPIIEQTALFSRGLGESTDAVSKEMFSFDDSDDPLSLRPEGTASCVRSVIAGNLARGAQPKFWYAGSMFRHERPQLGRYREFFQVGAEAFGLRGPDVDAELIRLVQDVFEKLSLDSAVELEINTLGNAASRQRHRAALVDYLLPHKDRLDADSVRRLDQNPMRILDSKVSTTQEIVEDAPQISAFLDEESLDHFEEFKSLLSRSDIDYKINTRLVRGLDYYTGAVFEWNTESLGAQKQVGGGGRYDGLCELLGGAPCPAAGFSMGIDRLSLLRTNLELESPSFAPDVYVLALGEGEEARALKVASHVRTNSNLRVRSHQGGGKVKARMRSADRSGAKIALIIGAEEAATDHVSLKWLRTSQDQVSVPISELVSTLLSST